MKMQQAAKPGWRMVTFGDVVKNLNVVERDPVSKGIERIVGLEHIDPENLHIRRWNSVEEGTSFTRKFVPGQTLFGKRRAYQRKVAFAEFEGICSGDILTFEPKSADVLLPELLPFICQTDAFIEHALNTSAGSLSPRTSWSALQDFQFPLPPLDEQKRIAEILWAADEAVEQYKESLDSLTMIKNKVLRKSFRHKLAKRIPCRDLYTHTPKNGLSPVTNACGSGYPTLSIGAVRNGKVDPNGNIKFAEIAPDELEKFRLNCGDILVVRGNGNKVLCGKAGLVSDIPENCFYPDLLVRIGFDEQKILPPFAVAQWNESLTHGNLLAFAKSTNGIWKINQKDLLQHKLMVPPIEIQKEVVRDLSIVDEKESALHSHIERLQLLQRNLSHYAIEEDAHV